MLLNAFRRLFNNFQNRKARRASGSPRLELLRFEDRINPATITVDTTLDIVNSGDTFISLREAINLANATAGDDIINFSVTGTITLDSLSNTVNASLPTILDATALINGAPRGTLAITGPGSSSLTISGLDDSSGTINSTRNFNIFNIALGGNLSISGVTVSGAKFNSNGGAFNNAGVLTVSNSTLSGNSAPTGGGGGIFNSSAGTVNISNSTFSANSANNGGGIYNRNTLTLTNSTISGNSAGSGGGIYNNGGNFALTNSTLSGNTAQRGGGIYNNDSGNLNIANTIIANSTGGDYVGDGTVTVALISPATASSNLVTQAGLAWATTKTSAEINLGTLANNGGPTFTMALLAGSAAIGAGNVSISSASPILGKDQRGINRTTSDIGAYSFGIQVTNTTDSNTVGSGSLRAAITLANTTPGNDQISFSLTGSSPYTITLNGTLGALPTILDATALINGAPRGTVTITGLGASSLTISGLDGGNNARNFRIFNIASGGNLFISGVTVSGANTSGVGGPSNTGTAYGGGFFNSGILTVNNSTISGNTANNGIGGSGSGSGGGIFNYNGTLSVSNSTISGNTAGMLGGGIENRGGTLTVNNSTLFGNTAGGGGGIHNGGTLTVNNSTLSGNTAGGGGGISNVATLNISNSTISGNTASSGGGIYNYGPQYPMGSFGTLNIANTIIANSTNGGDYAGGGTVVLIGSATAANNLITQLAPIPGIGDWATTVTSVQLNLGPLQNNGGPTFTMALLTGSSAIGAGNATISNATPINGKDQRGINRTTSDIGAYSFGIQVTTTADTVNSTDNVTSLREAITLANTTPGNDQISFNLTGANTYTITLAAALPTIVSANTLVSGGTAGTVTITGLGASLLSISGSDITNVNNATRDFNIFNIAAGGNLLISGVTVSGGQQNNNGGGFFNSGILTVNNSTISGNTVNFLTGSGGGIFNFNGILTVNNSTISGNTVNFIGGPGTGSGGGILNNGGILTVNNSTISGNTADFIGGGIGNSYGGTVTVSNSTISGNTSSFAGGGGISNRPGGTVTVSNSTLSGNTALFGGGIENRGTLNIANTIIANSTSGGDYASNGGTIGTNSNNLVEDGTLPAGTNNKTGDPNLSPLQNNGGPTATMALLTPSPAISTTLLVTPNLDQRGFTRINNDIGAYTYYVPPTVASISPTSGSTAGGTVITITGTNFVAGPNVVSINGVAATNVNFVSATSITATTSAGTAGANKSVLVTSAGGTNAANTLFTYAAAPSPTPTPTPPNPAPAPAPAPTGPMITGTPPPPASSGSSTVNLYDPATGQPMATGTAVPFPGFDGPITVVSGDFNNDGVADLVAGAGFGGGPAIAILDSQTGQVMEAFWAFDPAFTGGVFVAVQDTNGDGILDIIASAGPGGGPEVRIFNGANLNLLRSFYAYDQSFTGGVSVATIDFNNDGILDIVTGAGPGGAPHVKVYDGATNAILSQWYAYPASFTGGIFVAVGDIGNDGTFEVVTGAGPTGAPVVAVWDPFTGALLAQFMAYAESFTGGVRVAVNDGNGDGFADIVTGAGPGGGPQVNVFSFPALDLLFSFYSGEATNPGGVFVS